MNSDYYRSKTIDLFNSKKIYARRSDQLVTFVDEITPQICARKQGAFSDLSIILDFEGKVEGDHAYMYCELKDGETVNMEDFLHMYHAFDDPDTFIEISAALIADRES